MLPQLPPLPQIRHYQKLYCKKPLQRGSRHVPPTACDIPPRLGHRIIIFDLLAKTQPEGIPRINPNRAKILRRAFHLPDSRAFPDHFARPGPELLRREHGPRGGTHQVVGCFEIHSPQRIPTGLREFSHNLLLVKNRRYGLPGSVCARRCHRQNRNHQPRLPRRMARRSSKFAFAFAFLSSLIFVHTSNGLGTWSARTVSSFLRTVNADAYFIGHGAALCCGNTTTALIKPNGARTAGVSRILNCASEKIQFGVKFRPVLTPESLAVERRTPQVHGAAGR